MTRIEQLCNDFLLRISQTTIFKLFLCIFRNYLLQIFLFQVHQLIYEEKSVFRLLISVEFLLKKLSKNLIYHVALFRKSQINPKSVCFSDALLKCKCMSRAQCAALDGTVGVYNGHTCDTLCPDICCCYSIQ
jgi:hypothetical protein